MIPNRLIRTVPVETTASAEAFWDGARALHPGWECVTLRDPVNRDAFPITRHLWDTCQSGAQLADLIRLEALWWGGGWYLDSDVEVFRSLAPLSGLDGVAAWEDPGVICNAVLGFTATHPALHAALVLAIARHREGTWEAGTGACTLAWRDRDDMALLPPGVFFPVSWRTAHQGPIDSAAVRALHPWAFAVHHYHHSWK